MFDPRWNDDPRDRDEGSRDLSRGSRGGGSDPRERDRVDPRAVTASMSTTAATITPCAAPRAAR